MRIGVVVLAALIIVASATTYALFQRFQVGTAPQSQVIHSNVRFGLELTASITPVLLTAGQEVTVVA